MGWGSSRKQPEREMYSGWVAVEDVGEYHDEKIANKETQEDVVGYHPSFRCQTRKSSVEERDGDLY